MRTQLSTALSIIPIPVPPEYADEPPSSSILAAAPRKLKTIWWFRERMYHTFDIAKRGGKTREITAPDERLKILHAKLKPLLA